jgi:hypothetical protein
MRAPSILLTIAACAAVSCGGAERVPAVPPSSTVNELRESAGDAVQDCGQAIETKSDTTCKVHPVGECIQAALRDCRAAYGLREYFTAEGDPVRDDWFVLSDGQGGCELVLVEDRSADPLAARKPSLQVCDGIEWKPHDAIASCEMPVLHACHAGKKHEP